MGDITGIYMTNRKRFFYNGILLTIVALCIKTVNLFFGAFVSRKIGAEALGLYTVIGSVYSFAVTFATSGASLTVTRLVAGCVGDGRREQIPYIMRHAVKYALIFSGCAAAVLFFGAGYFAKSVLSEARAEAPLKLLAFSLIPIALSSVLSGYFIGVKRIARNAAVQVSGQIFRVGISVFFILKMAERGAEYGVMALCLSSVLSELFSFLVAFLQYLFEPRVGRNKKEVHFYGLASQALPLAFSSYIRSALLTLEHILIPRGLRKSGESEGEALASYGLLHGMALPMVLYPMTPLSSFAGLLVPEFAECNAGGGKERMKRICEDVIKTTLAYSAPAAVFIYLFSEELGYIIYSSFGAGHYIAMLAPVLPIMYLDHVTDAMLKGIGEQVYSMWVNITDSLLSVILVLVLIPRMGISGYALVIIIMEGYNFLLSFLRLEARIKFSPRVLLSILPPAAFALVSALAAKTLFRFSGALVTPLWLVLKLVFCVSLFIAMQFSAKLVMSRFEKKPREKALESSL